MEDTSRLFDPVMKFPINALRVRVKRELKFPLDGKAAELSNYSEKEEILSAWSRAIERVGVKEQALTKIE